MQVRRALPQTRSASPRHEPTKPALHTHIAGAALAGLAALRSGAAFGRKPATHSSIRRLCLHTRNVASLYVMSD